VRLLKHIANIYQTTDAVLCIPLFDVQ